MECYVGLDVHSKASVFVIQDGHGQVMAQGEMPTTPEGLRRWYDAQHLPAGTPVALETGTVAFFVARELTALGCAPSVIDAREVRLKASRPTQKSDRRDAFESLRRAAARDLSRRRACAAAHGHPRARDAVAPPAFRAPRDGAGQRGEAPAPRRGPRPPQPESEHRGRVEQALRGAGRVRGAARVHRTAPHPLALCTHAAGHPGGRADSPTGGSHLRAGSPPTPDHPRCRADRGRGSRCQETPIRSRDAGHELLVRRAGDPE
jgi:hypothetical protein